MEKRNIIGMAVIVIAIVIFTGCVEKESQSDIEFKSWCTEQSKMLDSNAQMLEVASANNDLAEIEVCASQFHAKIKIAMEEIEQFEVSREMLPTKKNFKLVLEECKNGTYYIEQGAKNSDIGDLRKGNQYLDYAIEHIEAMHLVNEI
jgi:hypothetical protein